MPHSSLRSTAHLLRSEGPARGGTSVRARPRCVATSSASAAFARPCSRSFPLRTPFKLKGKGAAIVRPGATLRFLAVPPPLKTRRARTAVCGQRTRDGSADTTREHKSFWSSPGMNGN
ncbi:hypothetical protein SKAU_G00212960 [Synaphobranchus kaupii]|uniref:Uncharacterized protein n=1 Tax=Synaphobranchus kaupii TaxID=118154 RepID=A0A9Q1F998_SYNKA|nr:hypothetical protein SKAU_G00212960 [Synaphobranchus kaupii]